MQNKYFGSYYPTESKIHSLSVITKIIVLFLLLIPLLLSTSVKLQVVILFIMFTLAYISKVPLIFYFDIIYGLRYLLIILVVLLSTKGLNLTEALTILFKIFNTIIYLSLIFYTTSPSELKYGLEKVLNIFNIFNLRISIVINKLVNIVSFFPLLLITEHEVLVKSSCRGLDYFHTDIVSRIIVVIKSFKNTLRLTINKLKKIKQMNSLRGYSTKKYRTNLRTNKITINDIILLLITLILIYYVILERSAL